MPSKRTTKIEAKPVEIDGIPTCDGLVALGREYAWRRDGHIFITLAGHALIGEALRKKAQEALARGDGDWTRPPSSGREGMAR